MINLLWLLTNINTLEKGKNGIICIFVEILTNSSVLNCKDITL